MSELSKFSVVAVSECDAPPGAEKGRWTHYVVANQHTRIEGIHRGSVVQGRRHATEFADELNARASNGYSTWAPRSRVADARKTQSGDGGSS